MIEEQIVRLKRFGLIFPIRTPYTPCSFTDLGFVPSIAQQRRELDVNYKFGEHYSNTVLSNDSYIYFSDQHSRLRNLYTGVHEEAHVTEFFDKLDLLAAKMAEKRRVRIDFSKISYSDLSAEVGAVFGLEEHGFDPQSLIDEGKLAHPYLEEAWKYYQNSRVPERTIFIPSSTGLELRLAGP